jgi:tetratricopeptide (TPR) repeat protein
VRTAVDEAKRVVDQALQAGAEVLELDPQDRYGCRKWLNKNQPDPLAEERQQLQAARANVEAIGHALLDGLAAWRAAQERAAQAENAGKMLVCDEDYARAIRLWEETGQLCQASLDKLRQAASTPPRTPHARALAQDAASIQERVEQRLAHGQEQRQHYCQQLEQLQDRYREAQDAEHHAHSRAAWRTARDAYGEVLALNPTYQPAMKGYHRCQSEVNKPARPWWPYALAAALGIVLVGFLAWFFGVGPGSRAEIVPTPTQATIVTGPAITPVLTPVTITSSPGHPAPPYDRVLVTSTIGGTPGRAANRTRTRRASCWRVARNCKWLTL